MIDFKWTSSAPEDATKAIFSWGAYSLPSFEPGDAAPRDGQISLGYIPDSVTTPVLAVVNDVDASTALAWIATYMPEAFPLTQSIRVLSFPEYKETSRALVGEFLSPDFVWASVVLGEMASQGNGLNLAVDKLPISRALGCFSFAAARASALYSQETAITRTVCSRLTRLGKSNLFSKKAVPVESLATIWQFVDAKNADLNDLADIVHSIMSAIEETSTAGEPIDDLQVLDIEIRKLSSGPIELRVMEYERACAKLVRYANTDARLRERAPMYLSAMTFWVGRGTSHISLLGEFADKFPSVYSWMGLFAGLGGPTCWDQSWLRACSAVDRLIRAPFALSDPPVADLAWMEYELISDQNHPAEWLKELVKLTPKALTVEVFSGVSCQMRIASDELEGNVEDSARKANVVDPMAQVDRDNISLAIELLSDIVARGQPVAKRQSGLFEEAPKVVRSYLKKKTTKRDK